jgi:hypothetical protein
MIYCFQAPCAATLCSAHQVCVAPACGCQGKCVDIDVTPIVTPVTPIVIPVSPIVTPIETPIEAPVETQVAA